MPDQLAKIAFVESVLERDNNECVVCGEPTDKAYHIFDKHLFIDNAGYFPENGVSLCEQHHKEHNETLIKIEDIYNWLEIDFVKPDTLEPHKFYDKWGNEIVDGMLIPGPLYEESLKFIPKEKFITLENK